MAHTVTKHCDKCNLEFRANVYDRHFKSCSPPKKKKIRGVDFDPNAGFKDGTRVAWNKGKGLPIKPKGAHGGYRENAGRTQKYHVLDSFQNDVCLQSSYELLCSQILDKLGIKWIRPSALKYDGGTKRYFPDFKLVESGIYLDPKNDYLAKIDQDKINKVIKENNVRIVILTKDMINEQTLGSLSREASS